jgi:predicted negative regulator of RcsB-dependent stress response
VDELSEQEQWDSLKRWVRTNGPQVLVMVALMLLGWYGWKWWQGRGVEQAREASAIYQDILAKFDELKMPEGVALIDQLRKDHPKSPYVDAADMVAARVYVESNQLDKAIEALQRVATGATDLKLRPVAQIRLARVQAAQGNYDVALATLGDKPLGNEEPARLEVRGDILLAKGDMAGALAAYEEARQLHPGSGEADDAGQLLNLKIADLKSSQPVSVEAPAAPAATAEKP